MCVCVCVSVCVCEGPSTGGDITVSSVMEKQESVLSHSPSSSAGGDQSTVWVRRPLSRSSRMRGEPE